MSLFDWGKKEQQKGNNLPKPEQFKNSSDRENATAGWKQAERDEQLRRQQNNKK